MHKYITYREACVLLDCTGRIWIEPVPSNSALWRCGGLASPTTVLKYCTTTKTSPQRDGSKHICDNYRKITLSYWSPLCRLCLPRPRSSARTPSVLFSPPFLRCLRNLNMPILRSSKQALPVELYAHSVLVLFLFVCFSSRQELNRANNPCTCTLLIYSYYYYIITRVFDE